MKPILPNTTPAFECRLIWGGLCLGHMSNWYVWPISYRIGWYVSPWIEEIYGHISSVIFLTVFLRILELTNTKNIVSVRWLQLKKPVGGFFLLHRIPRWCLITMFMLLCSASRDLFHGRLFLFIKIHFDYSAPRRLALVPSIFSGSSAAINGTVVNVIKYLTYVVLH